MTKRAERNLKYTTGIHTAEHLSSSQKPISLYKEISIDHISEDAGIEMSDDEKIDLAARHILEKYRDAFLELAK